MITTQVVQNSVSSNTGLRVFTARITFPRIILAELNTHRMLSKNSGSSRAIPAKKMRKSVDDNTFFPLAFQKEHSGMQGSEYISNTENNDLDASITEWSIAKDWAIIQSTNLSEIGVTKQLTNRLLEPFMYHTVLISGTEWENFFELRCPQYVYVDDNGVSYPQVFRSRLEMISYFEGLNRPEEFPDFSKLTDLEWRTFNKGQAEIHMMELAEELYDSYHNASITRLEDGEWHIPYQGELWQSGVSELDIEEMVKASTAIAARTSYTLIGEEKEINVKNLLGIHDRMANAKPFHASPFEHAQRTMTAEEFYGYSKTYFCNEDKISQRVWNEVEEGITGISRGIIKGVAKVTEYGWCRNSRGFIQYRSLLETGQSI